MSFDNTFSYIEEHGVLSGKIRLDEPYISSYVDKQAQNVVKYLNKASLKIALAESCTGGMLAQRITSVPGASNIFECGIVSYSERIKSNILGIDPRVIERHGVVSETVARLMAEGVCRLSGAEIGVGITGIAGPGGGSDRQPVGTIYVCVMYNGVANVKNLELYKLGALSREQNRLASAAYAFEAVLAAISGSHQQVSLFDEVI